MQETLPPPVVLRDVSVGRKIALILVMVGSALAVLWAATALSLGQVGWFHAIMVNLWYWPLAFGVTGGLHRLFTHRSYSVGTRTEWIIAALATLALEGPILTWVRNHTFHHAHSDEKDDIHSPHHQGNLWRGFWHAHLAWMFIDNDEKTSHLAKHIESNATLMWFSRTFVWWTVVSLVVPLPMGVALGLFFDMPWWQAAIDGFIWGTGVRVFFVHHVTWCINSVCHIWGRKEYSSPDESHNFLPTPVPAGAPWWHWAFQPVYWGLAIALQVLSLGESGHNTHHASPAHAQHSSGLDLTYCIIRLMEVAGLASNIKRFDEQLARKRLV